MSIFKSRLGPVTPITNLGSGQRLATPSVTAPKTKVCANCGIGVDKHLACSRCRDVLYCGKECQAHHWTKGGHKSRCGKYICKLCLDLDPIPESLDFVLGCNHHFHKLCVEGLKNWGISEHICPACRPELNEGPEQLFEVAIRRLFVLERRVARGDSYWDALAESDEADMKEIISILHQASAEGYGKSSCSLGLLTHLGHGVNKDDTEAVRWWTLAAEQNDAQACHNLSVMYRDGFGVSKDDIESSKWTLRAAQEGVVEAMHNLGTMYEFGDGVDQNVSEAIAWTRKAADAGYAPAQVHLATMYATGRCLGEDLTEAVKWFEMAALAGNVEGQLKLGAIHEAKEVVDASDEEAMRWYTAAADQGDMHGLFKLGCMFIENKGMPTSTTNKKSSNNWLVLSNDLSEENRITNALACFILAGSRGHELSKSLVDELRPKHSGGDAVPLPNFDLDSDPAAVVAAIANAAAEAAQRTAKQEKKMNKKKRNNKKK